MIKHEQIQNCTVSPVETPFFCARSLAERPHVFFTVPEVETAAEGAMVFCVAKLIAATGAGEKVFDK